MKRFIKIFTTTIFVTMLTTMLAACYTPNPLYGTWSDNDGNKIQFIDDGTFTATIKDSDNQLVSYSGDWSTYKEKREMEQLEKDIAALEEEKKQIEEALCGGVTSVDEITAMSKRLPVLNDELDEKSMRWLELSEVDS